jgi:hypothetical protein
MSEQRTVNHTEQHSRHILVTANRTCPCPTLVDGVVARAVPIKHLVPTQGLVDEPLAA